MIDRTSRDRLIEVMRSYMDDQITAFDLDEQLSEIRLRTDDKTVQMVAGELWFYYDDCNDHYVVASKGDWDYFNRLLLLLASDAEMAVAVVRRRWHSSQSIAAASLVLFVCLGILKGWGPDLIGLAFPFGIVSMFLAWFNGRCRRQAMAAEGAPVSPFPSFSVLRIVRRRVGGFARSRYPEELAGRKIRGRIQEQLLWVIWIPLWLMFSPIVLFIQTLPERQPEVAIMLPEVS